MFAGIGRGGNLATPIKVGGGGGIQIGTGPGPIVSGGGAIWVDSVTREVDIAAVNTWTALTNYGATATGDVQVPSRARFLSCIEISTAFDVNSTAAIYKLLTAIRMTGNGFVNGGMYRFLGQVGTHVQVNAFSAMSNHKVTTYMTRIPVSPSDKISIEGAMLAEDCGDLTMVVTLHFTSNDPGGGITDADVRHANIAAVDTSTSLTTFGADTLGVFKVPSHAKSIIGVCTALAVDFAAGAAAQRAVGVCQLTGNGLANGGTYTVQTGSQSYSGQGAAGDGLGGQVDIHTVGLAIVGANEITANAQMIGEDSGDVEFALGILYG